MPGANPPRVPEGLRDMMKSLTKEVLREKPSNIIEFSAQYFETMLHDGRDSPVRNYEPQESYETIMKNRVKHQVPLSLVYSVVPESLTELIKEFIKAVLRQKPQNICEFAVEYFRQQQMMKEMQSNTSVDYTSYDNYFQKKDRYSYTSYVKCTCGRLLGNAAYESNYINIKKNKLRQTSKASKSSIDDTSAMCKIEHEQADEMSKTVAVEKNKNDIGIQYIKAVYVIQRHFRLYLARKRKTKQILSKKVMVPSSSSSLQEAKQSKQRENLSMETAALILQKAYRKFLKNNRLRNQNTLQEEALISNEISPHGNMSMETAALIIQKAFHKFSNKRLYNNTLSKTTKMSKLETSYTEGEGDESNDNMSETASYTSASTALLSTESVGEHFDLSGANEEGVLHQTIQEDEEVENDNQNTITLSNRKKLQNLNKDKVEKTLDIKGSADVTKSSAYNEKDIKLHTSETENPVGLNQSKGKDIEVTKIVNDSLRTIIDEIELDTSHKDESKNSENHKNNMQETTKELAEETADTMKSDSLDDILQSIKIKSVIEGEEDYEITIDNGKNNTTETNDISSNISNHSKVSVKGNSIDLNVAPQSQVMHKIQTQGSASKVNNKSSKDLETVDPIMSNDNLESLPEKMVTSEISVEEPQKAELINSKSSSQHESDTKDDRKKEISMDAQTEIKDTILKTLESAQLLLNNQNVQSSDVSEPKSLHEETDGIKNIDMKDSLKEEVTQENAISKSAKETTQNFINFEQNNESLEEKIKPVEDTGTTDTDILKRSLFQSSDHDNEATSNTLLNDQTKEEIIQESVKSEHKIVDSQKLESIEKQVVSEPQIKDNIAAGNKENDDENKLKEEPSSRQEESTSDQNLSEQKPTTPSKNSKNLQSHDDESNIDKTNSAKSKPKVVDSQKTESIDKQIVLESQKSDNTLAGNKLKEEEMNKLEEGPLQEVSTSEQNLSEHKIETVSESSENLQPSDDKSEDDKLQELTKTPSDKTVNEKILKRERRALNDTKTDTIDSAEGSSKLNISENEDSQINVALDGKEKDALEENKSLTKLDDSAMKVESGNKKEDLIEGTNSLNKSENDVSNIIDESDDKEKGSSLGKTSSLKTSDNNDSNLAIESSEEIKLPNQTSDPERISSSKSTADGTLSREESLKDSDLSKTNLDEANEASQEKPISAEFAHLTSDTEPLSVLNESKVNTKDNSVELNESNVSSSQIKDNDKEKLKDDNAHKSNLSDSNVTDRNKEEPSITSESSIDGSENTNTANLKSNTKPQQRDITTVTSQDSIAEATSEEKTEKDFPKTTPNDRKLNEHATKMLTPKSSVDDTQNLSSSNSDPKIIENVLEHNKLESNEQNEHNSRPSNESLRESLSLNDNLDDKILTKEETTSATTDESIPERESSAKSSQELNSVQPTVELLYSVQSNKSLEDTISKEDDQTLEKQEGLPQSVTTSDITKQSDEEIPQTDPTNVESVVESSEIDNTSTDKKSHEDRETSKEELIQKINSSDTALNEQNVGETPEKSITNEPLVDHIHNATLTEVNDVKDLLTMDNLETNNKSSEFKELKQSSLETVPNEQTVKASSQKSENSNSADEIITYTKLSEDEDDTNEKETKGNDTQENATSNLTLQKTSQPESFVQSAEMEIILEPTLANENSDENQDLSADQQSAQESDNTKKFVEDPLNRHQSLNKSNSDSSDNKNEANVKSSQDDESTESNKTTDPPRSASIKITEAKSKNNKSTKSDSLDEKYKDNDDMRSEVDNSAKSRSGEHKVSTTVPKSISDDEADRTEPMSSNVDNSQKSKSGEEEVTPELNSVSVVERTQDMLSKDDNFQKSGFGEHEVVPISNTVGDIERAHDMIAEDDNSHISITGEREVERVHDMFSKVDNSQKSGSVEYEVDPKSNSVGDAEKSQDKISMEDNSQNSVSGQHKLSPNSNSIDNVKKSQDMIYKEDNSQKSESGEHGNSTDASKSNSVDDVDGTKTTGNSKHRPGIGPSGKSKDKNLRGSKHKVDDLSSSQIDDNKTIGTSKLTESSNNKLTHAGMLPNSKKLHSSNQKDKKVDYSSGRLNPVPIAELQLKSFRTPADAGPWYEVHVEKPKEEEKISNANVKREVHQNTEQSINEKQREDELNSNISGEDYRIDEESIFGTENIDSQSDTSSYESNKSTLELLYAYHLNHELRYNSEISQIERLIGLMNAADQDVSYLKDPLDYTNYSKEEERIPKYVYGMQSQESTPSSTNNKSSISFFVPLDNQDNQSAVSKKQSKQNLQKLDIKGNNKIQPTTTKELLSQAMIEDSLDEIMEMEDIIINETMPGKSLLQTIPEQNENESPSPQISIDNTSILAINESDTSGNNLETDSKREVSLSESEEEMNSQNLTSELNSSTQHLGEVAIIVDDTDDPKPNQLKSSEKLVAESDKETNDIVLEPTNSELNSSTQHPGEVAIIVDDTDDPKPNQLKSSEKLTAESDKETNGIVLEPTNSELSIEDKPPDLDSSNEQGSVDSTSDKGAGKHGGIYEKVHHEISKIVHNFNSVLEGANKSDLLSENVEPANMQDTRGPQSEIENIEKDVVNKEFKESSEKDGVTDENEPQEETLPEVTYSEDDKKYDGVHEKEYHGIDTSDISEQNLKSALPESISSDASMEKTENVKPDDKMSEKGDENEEEAGGEVHDNVQEKDSLEITTSAINEQNLKPASSRSNQSELSIEEPAYMKSVNLTITSRPQSVNKISAKGEVTEKLKEDVEKDEIVTTDINERNLSSAKLGTSNSQTSMDEIDNVKTGDLEENKLNEKDNKSEDVKERDEKDDEMYKEEVNEIVTSVLNVLNLNSVLPRATNSQSSRDEIANVKPTDLESTQTPRSVGEMSAKDNENEEITEGGEKDDGVHKEEVHEIVTSVLNVRNLNSVIPGPTNSQSSIDKAENTRLDLESTRLPRSVDKMSAKDNENEEFKEGDNNTSDKTNEKETDQLVNSDLNKQNLKAASHSESSMDKAENGTGPEEKIIEENNSIENSRINEVSRKDDEMVEEEPHVSDMNSPNFNVTLPNVTNSDPLKDETENVEQTDLKDTIGVNKISENGDENKEFKEDAKKDIKIEREDPQEIATSELNVPVSNDIISEHSMEQTENVKPVHLEHVPRSQSANKIDEIENEIFTSELIDNNVKEDSPGTTYNKLSMEETQKSKDMEDTHEPQAVNKLYEEENKIEDLLEGGESNDKVLEIESNETVTSDINEQDLNSSLPDANNSKLSMDESKNIKPTDLDDNRVSQSVDQMSSIGVDNEEYKEGGERPGEINEKESIEISTSNINEHNLNSSLSRANSSELSMEKPPVDLEDTREQPSVDKMSNKGEEVEEFKEVAEINKETLEKDSYDSDLKEQNVEADTVEAANSKSSLDKTENSNSVDKNEVDALDNENVSEQDDKNEHELKTLRSTDSDSLIEETDNVKSTDLEATHGPIDKMDVQNEGNEIIASNEVNEENKGMDGEDDTFEITTSELDEQKLDSSPEATHTESYMGEPDKANAADMESESIRMTRSVDKLNDEIVGNELTKQESTSKGAPSEEDNINQQIDSSKVKDGDNEIEVKNELSGKAKHDSDSYESIREDDGTDVNLNVKIAPEIDESKLEDKVESMSDMARRIAAAIVIQRAYRRFLKSKNNKNTEENSKKLKEIAENEAASVIQKAFRQYIYNISHKKQRQTNLESSDMESFENIKSENSSNETSPSVSQITQIYKMNRSESQISTDTIENLSNVDYFDGSDSKLDSPKSKWFVGNEPIESTKEAPNLIQVVDSPSLSIVDTNSSDSEKLLVIADTEPQLVACLNNVDDSNLKSNLSIGNNIIGDENGESVERTNENSKNNDLAGLREDETQTSESGNKEDNNALNQNDEPIDIIKYETKIDETVATYDENINEEMLVEVIEKPCIKKTVSQSNLNEIESEGNEVTETKRDIKSAESPESETETDVILKTIETDSLDAATEKLFKADEVIEKMFSRRLSETKSSPLLSEMTFKEPSFDEPVIRPMSALHENISIDLEETDIVVLNRLQREDTRESSAQSDAIVFGENNLETDDKDALENIEVSSTRMKRLYTIAGDDTNIIFKSVTIDETVKYIDPPNATSTSTSATSGSSFCLDDDISENIRQKMMAYSLSEADSDYFEGNTDGPDTSVDRSAVRNDDFNISTALADTPGTSTETESTIVSAATKIQASARGFLTRRRLRRLSGGTTTSNQETKASFGNEAISESLERFIEDEAAKKIQFAYRNHYYKKGKVNDEDNNDDDGGDEGASLDNSLAARRLTLQRGDALRNDSTPDEDHNDNGKNTVKLNNTSNTKRSKPLGDYRLKPWAAMRQNSMPVQIDTNIFRVIPKQLSKRIKSAENEKKQRRITSFKKK